MKLEFSRQIFDNYSNTRFHENPSSGSRAVPCGLTDMAKLTVAFRIFANAPANCKTLRSDVASLVEPNAGLFVPGDAASKPTHITRFEGNTKPY